MATKRKSKRRTSRTRTKSRRRRARLSPAISAATKFFYKHAGWGYKSGVETPAQGRRRGAVYLARAEAEAARRGWHVNWEYSEEPYEMGDAETEMPSEVFDAILYDENDRVIGSLGHIGDPSREYKRVVEAELAVEALY